MRIYVGNLPYTVAADELREEFGRFGKITDVHVPMDRETGKPRGFAFIEFEGESAAQAAIDGLNSQQFGGRRLTVNKAQDRPPRSR